MHPTTQPSVKLRAGHHSKTMAAQSAPSMAQAVGKRPSHCVQPLAAADNPNSLLRLPTVSALVGLSRSTIYAKAAVGKFPQPLRLSSRCTRWRSSDITSWLQAQAEGAAA